MINEEEPISKWEWKELKESLYVLNKIKSFLSVLFILKCTSSMLSKSYEKYKFLLLLIKYMKSSFNT